MARLLLAAAVLFSVLYGINYIRKQPPEQQKKLWLQAILIAGAVTLGLLALTGRLHWLGIVFAAMIPLIRVFGSMAIRFMPILGPWLKRRAEQHTTRAKSTSTPYLQFVVDDNGDMGGQVLRGVFAGKQLKDLTESELLQFAQETLYCRDTQQVFTAYLNKYYPHLTRKRSSSNGNFTQEQAEKILGLGSGYGKQDVIDAHRKLMQKLHPDRGGNDYLAAQINAAKELLMAKF